MLSHKDRGGAPTEGIEPQRASAPEPPILLSSEEMGSRRRQQWRIAGVVLALGAIWTGTYALYQPRGSGNVVPVNSLMSDDPKVIQRDFLEMVSKLQRQGGLARKDEHRAIQELTIKMAGAWEHLPRSPASDSILREVDRLLTGFGYTRVRAYLVKDLENSGGNITPDMSVALGYRKGNEEFPGISINLRPIGNEPFFWLPDGVTPASSQNEVPSKQGV